MTSLSPGTRSDAERWQAVAMLAAAGLTILLWELTPVTTRIAAGQVDGTTIGVFRTVGAGIFAAPIVLAFRLRPPRDRADWRLLAPVTNKRLMPPPKASRRSPFPRPWNRSGRDQ